MNRKPHRIKKYRKIVEACLFVVVSLSFVLSNLYITKFLPPFDAHGRSLSWYDGRNGGELTGQKNDDDTNSEILHVVTSRFMQGQPTLRALAKARLKLFETFCLPTMLHQDAKNFLWFIMAEPQLDKELLDHLQSLLEPIPNFYLVASNEKLLTPSNITTMLSSTQQKGSTNSVTTMHPKMLLTGDIELLKHRMLDPNRPLLLETRLDADDGLNHEALTEIQTIAKALPVDTNGWQIICSNLHFEWRNVDILDVNSNATTNISSGKLRIVKESICVTPGYTLVRHRETPSIDFPPWPKLGHNQVNGQWPECRVDNDTIVGISVESNDGNATYDCWKKMGLFPSALRSRTVTSAGMSRVESTGANAAKFESLTDQFWEFVQRDFDIVPEDARSTSQYLREHLGGIAFDNLEGQCSPGHSCKNSSKIKLEEIIAKTSRLKSDKFS